MNNDRELSATCGDERMLLELAAKAAGITYKAWVKDWDGYEGLGIDGDARNLTIWNPLTDDGDAMRLAVKLGIDIQFFNDGYNAVTTSTYSYEDDVSRKTVESLSCDVPYAATRRAIVRAAAEIGRTM